MSDFLQRKGRARLQEARAALARNELGAAIEAFEAGLRLDPSDREAWESWADCLERSGALLEAASVLRRGLEHHPDDPALELSLVHALIESGQFAAAEHHVVRLREVWPRQRPPLAYHARLLRDIRAYGRLRELLEGALAGDFGGDKELAGLLDACLGWQGLKSEPAPVLASMRELLLMQYGSVLLGTGHDDGVTVPWYSTYLCSNYDVVATCARLLGFAEAFGWSWQVCAALDPAAQALALLLARALDIDCIELPAPDSPMEAYPDPDHCLAVASFLSPGWSGEEHGEWALRCADQGNLFAFGALDYANHREGLPPILGLAAGERVCLPWWRLGEARIGFGRFGLIDDLPPEIDERSPANIADDYYRPLSEFETGPNFVVQLRHVLEQRAQLQPGLRARSDFARILPRAEPRSGPSRPLPDALVRGDTAEFLRAVGVFEQHPETLDEAALELLESRFTDSPGIRPRLSDLLYRVAPARLAARLHALVSRPEPEVPWRERDGLLHLYGCNPWTAALGEPGRDPSRVSAQLERWITLGSMTNRSEVVQSKYGLHHLAESPDFEAILDRLLGDEAAIVLGTLRWLHDNAHLHGHVQAVVPLLGHAHADVVFEALQCTRVAGHTLEPAQLEPLLSGQRYAHPRMLSAAIEHLELWPIARAHPLLEARLRDPGGLDPAVAWAVARSLLRGGQAPGEDEIGARILAERIVELLGQLEPGQTEVQLALRPLLRALAGAPDYALFAPLLERVERNADMRLIAAALAPKLVALDDPRLLVHLRRCAPAFALDPPVGYAAYLLHHGDPEHDRDAVYGARGATEPRAAYEALAVLARWGDSQALAELEAALDYASPAREAAFEVWFSVLHREDFARIEAARLDPDPELSGRVWSILRETIAGSHPAPAPWRADLAAYLRASPDRAKSWADYIETQLRTQVPSKFVVGAQSADFGLLAELLPTHFEALCERSLGDTHDRLSVDLLEWLGRHRPPLASSWAARTLDSPHWGVRQVARRLAAMGPR